MKKYTFNPLDPAGSELDEMNLFRELQDMKLAYNACDKYIAKMRFAEDVKGSPVEIHLYVNLRKAIQDVITALDDIDTCRRYLHGED